VEITLHDVRRSIGTVYQLSGNITTAHSSQVFLGCPSGMLLILGDNELPVSVRRRVRVGPAHVTPSSDEINGAAVRSEENQCYTALTL
jgi:hypothetical protein